MPTAPAPEPKPYGYDGGFYLRTNDGKYSITANAFAQLVYTLTAPAGGKVNHNFDLGLGRLAFSGTVFDKKFSYFLQFQGSTFGNNNGITMLDWFLKYTFSPYISVLAGRRLLPYSRQFYTHPGQLLFADLSPAEYAFGLYRSIGVQVAGQVGRLGYDLFVVNSIRGLDSGTQVNLGDSVAFGGRLELDILKPYGYVERGLTSRKSRSSRSARRRRSTRWPTARPSRTAKSSITRSTSPSTAAFATNACRCRPRSTTAPPPTRAAAITSGTTAKAASTS
jgi:hypothetical protein